MNLHDIYLAAQLAGKNYAHINDIINERRTESRKTPVLWDIRVKIC